MAGKLNGAALSESLLIFLVIAAGSTRHQYEIGVRTLLQAQHSISQRRLQVSCRGIAFEFPDEQKTEILSYLEKREGKAFPLHEKLLHIEGQSEVSAFVPLYNGNNVIEGKTVEEIAEMVLAASGKNGTCSAYVKNIAEKLSALGINDPAVTELWKAVNTYI